MNGVRAVRLGLGGLGVAVAAYGAWLLWSRQRPEQVLEVAKWGVGGIVLHDVVVAGAVLLVAILVTRAVPRVARVPATVGAVVLTTVTLVAVPVLLAYGRKPDNPTLLDRDYRLGWVVVAVVDLVVVVAWSVWRTRRERAGQPTGQGS